MAESMTLSGASGSNVDVVNRRRPNASGARLKKSQPNQVGNTGQRGEFKPCGNSGTKHGKNKCPAYGKTCHHCGKRNHFQKLCRSISSVSNSVHEINNDGASNVYNRRERTYASEKEFFIDTVSANSSIHISLQ